MLIDSVSTPILVTKEQEILIRRLPKNCRDWKSLWRKHLLTKNLDLDTIERLINGEKYAVKDCVCISKGVKI